MTIATETMTQLRSPTWSKIRLAAKRQVPFGISVVLVLVSWEVLLHAFQVPGYVLPRPGAVWAALVDGLTVDPFSRASFCFHLADTLSSTMAGFVLGAAIALVVASLMEEWEPFERIAMPYVVGLQSMPKVAIAPLFIIWFGYGSGSKVAMAVVLALFPVLVNSLQGFRTTPTDRLELMKAIRATRWQTFRRVKLPGAMPLIMTGLNLGIVYALLGTIVAEFIGGSSGIGVVMTQLQSAMDTAGVFAILVLLAATGYLLMAGMRLIQKRLTFWAESQPAINEN